MEHSFLVYIFPLEVVTGYPDHLCPGQGCLGGADGSPPQSISDLKL